MKLIVGLGNPGGKYNLNRHNVGAEFVRFSQGRSEAKDFKMAFAVAPEEVYMNDSGKWVAERVRKYRGEWGSDWGRNLFVAHDDLDIPLGKFKIQLGKGPQVHNGILSIEESLGTKDFWRVRIGTDSRRNIEGKLGDSGKEYVLNDFTAEEMATLENLFLEIWKELVKIL